MKTREPQRFIYVIGPLAGLQKIGLTMDPKARLATLQTASAEDLMLHLAVRVPFGEAHAVERRAHQALERSRVRNDWFEVTPETAMGAVLAAAKPFPAGDMAIVNRGRDARRAAPVDVLPLFSFGGEATTPALHTARRPLWQVCRAALGGR